MQFSIKKSIKKWLENINIYFSNEDIHMAKKYVKRCSASLTFRKMNFSFIASLSKISFYKKNH